MSSGVRAASGRDWRPAFILAIASVIVAFIVFVAFVAGGLDRDGGGGGEPGTAPATNPPGGTATSQPPGTASPTLAPVPPGNVIGDTLVACGDPLAPLDKQFRLPADCAPAELIELPVDISIGGPHYLTPEAASAMVIMLADAASAGHIVAVQSSYRDYATQDILYNGYVESMGEAEAQRISARPGHSEHQLGTTADLTSEAINYELDEAWGATPEGQWIAANAPRYGYVISYPQGKEAVTGYAYEPWHVRYVGPEVAQQVVQSGLTQREFLYPR